MSSQSVDAALSLGPVRRGVGPNGEDTRGARLRLRCGCEVDVPDLAADRVLRIDGGGTLVVGKVPCPAGHPVRA